MTPMMERYLEVKRQHPQALLLFRMGDFYELFFEDAKIAAKVLGLTLTSRDKGAPDPIPMAGFPWHALESYLKKLIQAGYRAAICDQVEDPKQARGLVRREVTRVVTPGTLTDEALLDPREANFLACLWPSRRVVGLAWLELSTGRFLATQLAPTELADELARIRPAECLLPEDAASPAALGEKDALSGMMRTERPSWCFGHDRCHESLCRQFGVQTLEGFGFDDDATAAVRAAGALLDYVRETQKAALGHITRLEPYRRHTHLLVDETTRRSLELTRTMRDGKRQGSLIAVIDKTVTPMGARLLADWLANPLTEKARIEERLDAVEEFVADPVLCRDLQSLLDQVYDLERLASRIATRRAGPRDLAGLARSLSVLPKLKARLTGRRSHLLRSCEERLDLCPQLRADIESALVDDPPVVITEGGLIRPRFAARLDELRELARGGKQWMAEYQAREIQRTGIPTLKVGFNKVFGYYLEVTAAHKDKVPADYIRRQTLKNQERFITPELKQYEEKVLRAEEQSRALEQELFTALRERVAEQVERIQTTAQVLAEIDVLVGLATVAVSRNYTRPQITEEPVLDIRESRHPVLDALEPAGRFVPNDILLGGEYGRIQIVTGPNMAGKSTYIRQAALLTILAQMGSFVPAAEARIGIADRIFARVGASDELGKGQSTFMVEMTETARILHGATQRSLVILDEIGRGTSTYDGISLAWAVTEHLHDVIGCRTLFATHYHELTDLTQTLSGARNWNVAVREQDEGIVFLHRIVEGAADKSYGIHVARLAGLPPSVVERASVILRTLEQEHLDESGRTHIPPRPKWQGQERQLGLFGPESHPLLDEIRELDLERMTPLDALTELHRLREKLSE